MSFAKSFLILVVMTLNFLFCGVSRADAYRDSEPLKAFFGKWFPSDATREPSNNNCGYSAAYGVYCAVRSANVRFGRDFLKPSRRSDFDNLVKFEIIDTQDFLSGNPRGRISFVVGTCTLQEERDNPTMALYLCQVEGGVRYKNKEGKWIIDDVASPSEYKLKVELIPGRERPIREEAIWDEENFEKFEEHLDKREEGLEKREEGLECRSMGCYYSKGSPEYDGGLSIEEIESGIKFDDWCETRSDTIVCYRAFEYQNKTYKCSGEFCEQIIMESESTY